MKQNLTLATVYRSWKPPSFYFTRQWNEKCIWLKCIITAVIFFSSVFVCNWITNEDLPRNMSKQCRVDYTHAWKLTAWMQLTSSGNGQTTTRHQARIFLSHASNIDHLTFSGSSGRLNILWRVNETVRSERQRRKKIMRRGLSQVRNKCE